MAVQVMLAARAVPFMSLPGNDFTDSLAEARTHQGGSSDGSVRIHQDLSRIH
jgi:hypothetical protein